MADSVWQEIATIIGAGGTGIAAVAWLSKTIVSHFLSKEMEGFKSQAKQELTQFKDELEKRAYEHQVRFEWLHRKRAEVIEDIFKELDDADNKLFSKYENFFPALGSMSEDVTLTAISEVATRYEAKVESHPLYFSAELYGMLRSTGHKLQSAVKALQLEEIRRKVQSGQELEPFEEVLLQERLIREQMESSGEASADSEGFLDETMQEINETRSSVVTSKEVLAKEFRKMLGAG